MKKVIFDISRLGQGHKDEASKTGIFRTVEEILKQLINISSIDLYLIASQLNIHECKEYLEDKFSSHNLKSRLIAFNPNLNTKNKIFYCLARMLIKFNKIFPNLKTTKKIINQFGVLLHYFGIHLSYIEDVEAYDAYISLSHMIPRQICNSSIQKVLLIHDLIPMIIPESTSFFARSLQKTLINHFPTNTLVICNSQTTKKDLLGYRADLIRDNVKVIYLGASEIFQPTPKKHKNQIPNLLPSKVSKYILSVSSLNPRKNFLHVINSFLNLVKNYNIEDLYLVIVGPKGWEYQEIFDKLDSLAEYKDKIIMTGYIEDQYLPYLYSNTLCFIMMSLYEGFGLPVLEAMKCGAPVIVSDNSSLAEIASDAGIKLPPKDQNSLIEALHHIYDSKDLQLEMSQKSIEQSKKFSWQNFANELIKLI